MSQKTFPTQVRSAKPGVVVVFLKFTGAADVAANGYTINVGTEHVASVTRTGEGVARITMRETFKRVLGFSAHFSATDSTILFTAEDVDEAKTIDITYKIAGVATDPDSVVTYATIFLQNLA